MYATLEATLAIIDEGLRIYRRGFTGFIILATVLLIPFAISIGLLIAILQANPVALTILLLGILLLGLPLAMYLFGGMSRAALAVQQGRRIRIREALEIPLLRATGMGCYGLVFFIVANALIATLGAMCFCPLYFGLVFMFGGAFSWMETDSGFGAGLAILLVLLLVLIFILIYAVSLIVSGAAYSGTVYSLQAFIQSGLRFGASMQRSIDLTFFRFPRNLLAFLLASALFSALSITATMAIGVLLPLPLIWTLGETSPITQGVSASAWILGLIVVLPPMPIWMTLLYQRNQNARYGDDLAAQIDLRFASAPLEGAEQGTGYAR